MAEKTVPLGEPADEADWRALVEQGLKGAQWARLVSHTADSIPIQPLYREPDFHTATDVSGMPGAAPFVRGARAGGWLMRQAYEHPDPARTNDEILADLKGGAGAVELVIDPSGVRGVAIRDRRDFDVALSEVLIDIAPISIDAGAHAGEYARLLAEVLKGAGGRGAAFNIDPVGVAMRTGVMPMDLPETARLAAFLFETAPDARALRVDARPVHEAGGTEAQEIAAALSFGIAYLRALDTQLSIHDSARLFGFALSVGPDVLIEAAKLRALRLCWARVLEASGAHPEERAAHIHAFTSRRMMTRYDAWTNILRVTAAAFAAAAGGADEITTYPLTDALGLPTPFARRVARNTQNILLEECRLGHVADPAGGAWLVEKLTRELADKAWALMQQLEAHPHSWGALLPGWIADARAIRQRMIATRRETITGVTDFPLLGAAAPEVERMERRRPAGGGEAARPGVAGEDAGAPYLQPVRWAEPFEAMRDRAEAISPRPSVFFATLGSLAAFGPRAQFARNLFAAGGVGALGEEEKYESRDAMIDAFRSTHARVAVIVGTDGAYKDEAENAAQRLKAAGADWVVLAGKPGDSETGLRAAGVDQFVFAGQDALKDLETLHAALGIGA